MSVTERKKRAFCRSVLLRSGYITRSRFWHRSLCVVPQIVERATYETIGRYFEVRYMDEFLRSPACVSRPFIYNPTMPVGYFSLILHAHLPFVRHPEYPSFLEEDWLYEAITEVYLPIISFSKPSRRRHPT